MSIKVDDSSSRIIPFVDEGEWVRGRIVGSEGPKDCNIPRCSK